MKLQDNTVMNPQRIQLAFSFLLLGNLLASVQYQPLCLNNGNYTDDSAFRYNLFDALSSLSTDMDNNGFHSVSAGEDPDRVNAAALCRGDVQLKMCRHCIQGSALALSKSCPNQKQAIDWPEFCMVRYSNETIFGKMETSPAYWWWNVNNSSNPDQFEDDLRTLLDNIRGRAAYGGPLRKVAEGNVTAPDFQTIYALVQCTPDLSPDDCSSCLIGAAADIPYCCNRKRGGRVLRPSCTLRFEVYPFYNVTRLQELASVPAKFTCLNNGNYTANSTYSANLKTALSALSMNIDDNGFYNISVGQDLDRANAVALCRGDVQLDTCRVCVKNAADELLKSCPTQRQAINWPEFCMVRYSNEMIFGTMETSPGFCQSTSFNDPSPDQSEKKLRMLTDDLRGLAAYGGSLRKVVGGNVSVPRFGTIFGLVQCTPDLSPDGCSRCLIESAKNIPNLCDRKMGIRVLKPSCTLRFELYQFFNRTRLQELAAAHPPVPSPPGSKKDDNTTKIVIVIVTIVVCLLLAACGIIFLRRRIKQRPHLFLETTDRDVISVIEPLQYDFGEIRDATNNFSDSNKLGQGGFGVVYKGKLLNGQEIAVKRLSRDSRQGNLEFKNEVLLLARLQHKNLVKFLGFSLEGTERLLIYEFVQNSSLDQFIFDPIRCTYLDWNSRYKIIGGIARGLLYLHEDSRLRIVHRDLKASNILLDKEMNPKIADFGMARLFGQDETQGSTNRIVGTYGYMSPEYAMHGQFSPKSDVFSFGVLVLEILSGRKNSYTRSEESAEDLLSFIWKNWSEGIAANAIDPILRASTDSTQEILRCIHMGLLCVQENIVDRPTMASIVLMLNSYSITLPGPKKPAFFVDGLYGPKTKTTICEAISLNSMSVTQLFPR